MKYYSEVIKQVYDTPEALEEAEKVVLEEQKVKEEKLAKRAERAKEVEEAIKAAETAKEKANELINSFVEDYGSFHTTLRKPIHRENALDTLIDAMINSYFGF